MIHEQALLNRNLRGLRGQGQLGQGCLGLERYSVGVPFLFRWAEGKEWMTREIRFWCNRLGKWEDMGRGTVGYLLRKIL